MNFNDQLKEKNLPFKFYNMSLRHFLGIIFLSFNLNIVQAMRLGTRSYSLPHRDLGMVYLEIPNVDGCPEEICGALFERVPFTLTADADPCAAGALADEIISLAKANSKIPAKTRVQLIAAAISLSDAGQVLLNERSDAEQNSPCLRPPRNSDIQNHIFKRNLPAPPVAPPELPQTKRTASNSVASTNINQTTASTGVATQAGLDTAKSAVEVTNISANATSSVEITGPNGTKNEKKEVKNTGATNLVGEIKNKPGEVLPSTAPAGENTSAQAASNSTVAPAADTQNNTKAEDLSLGTAKIPAGQNSTSVEVTVTDVQVNNTQTGDTTSTTIDLSDPAAKQPDVEIEIFEAGDDIFSALETNTGLPKITPNNNATVDPNSQNLVDPKNNPNNNDPKINPNLNNDPKINPSNVDPNNTNTTNNDPKGNPNPNNNDPKKNTNNNDPKDNPNNGDPKDTTIGGVLLEDPNGGGAGDQANNSTNPNSFNQLVETPDNTSNLLANNAPPQPKKKKKKSKKNKKKNKVPPN